jgi:hypothetical protein
MNASNFAADVRVAADGKKDTPVTAARLAEMRAMGLEAFTAVLEFNDYLFPKEDPTYLEILKLAKEGQKRILDLTEPATLTRLESRAKSQ